VIKRRQGSLQATWTCECDGGNAKDAGAIVFSESDAATAAAAV